MFEYQNIVIAPDVFKYIKNSYSETESEDVDLRSYKQNLKLKCLVLDKRGDSTGLYTRLRNMIQESPDLAKNKLEIILNEFLLSNRIKFEDPKSEENFVENPEHNYIFNLAAVSNTKIINSQHELLLLYKSKLNQFEIVNIEDFINPPSKSLIFSLSRDIELVKGDHYNIYEELRYYWTNTKSLIVEDDYLRKLDDDKNNTEGQFPKLLHLIKTCKNLDSLTIRTPFNDSQQNSKLYLAKNSFINEIVKRTGINPKIEEAKVGERHYYTDYFKIHLGKGLDFYNSKQNFRVWRPKVTIRITPLIKEELN